MKFKKFLEEQNEHSYFIGKAKDHEAVKSLVSFFSKRNVDKLEEKFNNELLKVTEPHQDENDFEHQVTSKGLSDWHPAHKHLPEFAHLKHITNIQDEHQAKAVHLYSGSGSGTINKKLLRASRVLPGRKKYAPEVHEYKKHHEKDLAHADINLSRLIKNNKTHKDLHVYSGLGFSPEEHTHKSFHLPAYTSTSLKKSFALNWGSKITDSNHFYNSKGEKLNKKQYTKDTQHYRNIYWDRYGDHSETIKKYKEKYDGETHYSHAIHIHIPEDSHAFYTHHEPFKYKKINEYGEEHNQEITTRHPHEQEVILHKGAKVHIHPTPTVDHDKKVVLWHAKLVHDGVKPTKFGDLANASSPQK